MSCIKKLSTTAILLMPSHKIQLPKTKTEFKKEFDNLNMIVTYLQDHDSLIFLLEEAVKNKIISEKTAASYRREFPPMKPTEKIITEKLALLAAPKYNIQNNSPYEIAVVLSKMLGITYSVVKN